MNFLDPRLPGRFWSKCAPEPNTGCWLWLGYCDPQGYGRFALDGRAERAHRVAYLVLVGPISAGLEIDHRCRTKSCCNPAHLEAVDHQTNVLRGEAPAAQHSRQTRCKRGHDLALTATRHVDAKSGHTFRTCLACRRELHAAHRKESRA